MLPSKAMGNPNIFKNVELVFDTENEVNFSFTPLSYQNDKGKVNVKISIESIKYPAETKKLEKVVTFKGFKTENN